MEIDVRRLENDQEGRLEFALAGELEPFTFKGEVIDFKSPVEVSGVVEKEKKEYLVSCNVKASVILKCARCLKEFVYPVETSFLRRYAEEVQREKGQEEEILAINGDIIDLKHPVLESIILELPIKGLCSDVCKGLCPVCGKDRNIEECDCRQENIDLRLAELKKLLEE